MSENNYKTYQLPVVCSNCGEELGLEIPIGTTLEDYLEKERVSKEKIKCPKCGVARMFRRHVEKRWQHGDQRPT